MMDCKVIKSVRLKNKSPTNGASSLVRKSAINNKMEDTGLPFHNISDDLHGFQ